MIIDKVFTSNMEDFLLCVQSMNQSNITNKFGRNLVNLLNRVNITLIINEVSLLEAFVIKRMSTKCTLLEVFFDDETLSLDKNDKELELLHQSVRNLFTLTSSINDDEDIINKLKLELLPVKCTRCKIISIFSGNNLCQLLSTQPENSLSELIKDTTIENLLCTNDGIEKMNNVIVHSFIQSFYNGFISLMNIVDLATDSFINTNYYDYVDNNSVILSHVNTPFGSINFNGSHLMSIEDSIDFYKKESSTLNYELSYDDVTMFFEICCNFSTFLILSLKLPENVINNFEDLKILLYGDEIPSLEELKKYSIRIRTTIESFKSIREDTVSNSDKYNIEKFNYILGIENIKFTLRLSFDDINKIIPILDDYISDNTTLESNMILIIMNTIKQYSQSIYQNL